jgi:hypothetical protein
MYESSTNMNISVSNLFIWYANVTKPSHEVVSIARNTKRMIKRVLCQFSTFFFILMIHYSYPSALKITRTRTYHDYNLKKVGILAERLRREIRNLLGFPRVGSNPADVAIFFIYMTQLHFCMKHQTCVCNPLHAVF